MGWERCVAHQVVSPHCHVDEDQIGTVGVEIGQVAGFRDGARAIGCWEAIADVCHHGFGEGVVEWLVVGVGVVVKVEVFCVELEVALADERQGLVVEEGLLGTGQSGVEEVVCFRGVVVVVS